MSKLNSRKRKGFTLVEFAIVLIVIGVMLGVSVKGKDFIEQAKMTKAVSNINKIETAFNIYMAKRNNVMPVYTDRPILGGGTRSQIDPYILINENLINRANFLYKDEYAWDLVMCERHVDSSGVKTLRPTDSNPNYTDEVCIYSGLYDPATDGIVASETYVPADFVCNIEKMIDDLTVTDGRGRRATDMTGSSKILYSINTNDYNDCNNIKNEYTRYLLRVL